ncbi:GAF domain-containing protein [Agromyces sp. NPDC056523]|uniref:GAF domain-containing sensor histidine kinase n=1 Tax=Agromyces sp. NPDC056523 TaxID=3345850 RepID=UPI003671047C
MIHTQSRLRALLHATQAVVEQTELSEVLRRIVEAAVELVDAEYGALGVLAPQAGLEEFIHVGMPDDLVRRIGHLPEGQGVLGALIDHPEPIRLKDLRDDPRSVGFPEGHPPMHSFLGVPVSVRGEVFGNLYLTNQRSGEFSEEDIELTSALAAAAGVAIDNARRYDEARMREAWAAASAQVVAALLTDPDTEGTAALIVDELATRGAADRIALLVAVDGGHALQVVEARGMDAAVIDGAVIAADRTLGAVVLEGGESRATPGGRINGAADALALEHEGHVGPVLFVVIRKDGAPSALIVAGREPGNPHFTAAEMRIAEDFAERVSLAHELARAREAQQRSVLLEDRARIARDLHDHVVQQLYGAGLDLHTVATLSDDPASARIDAAVAAIDEAIAQVRTIVFALTPRADGTPSLRHRVLDLAAFASSHLPKPVAVTFTGPVDLVAEGELADELTASVRELLSNSVRHSGAASVQLTVVAVDGAVTAEVSDDGQGIDPSVARRSGLENLRVRAERLGGSFLIDTGPDGTHASWSVPTEPTRTERVS